MTIQRLAFLTRSFWPIVGPVESQIGLLAGEFLRGGHSVHLFTTQWEPDWSTELSYREVPVTRVPRASGGTWGVSRYARALAKELVMECPDWDAVVVIGGPDELEGAIRAKEKGGPRQVVLRLDYRLKKNMQRGAGFRKKMAKLIPQADAVCLPQPGLAEYFFSSVKSPPKVLADVVDDESFRPTETAEKHLLRESIGELHPLLLLSKRSVLGVYNTDFDEDPSLTMLLEAWAKTVRKVPEARLWLVGDGPQAASVWQMINDLGISHSAVLVGNFDHGNDANRAADFYIHPLANYDDQTALLEAMASHLPVVFSECESTPGFLQNEQTGFGFEANSVSDCARALSQMFDRETPRELLGRNAGKAVPADHRLSRAVIRWQEFLESVNCPTRAKT
ncbi:MAG: glycosyltransferase family 4 protein [Pirellulaceae bacterium]